MHIAHLQDRLNKETAALPGSVYPVRTNWYSFSFYAQHRGAATRTCSLPVIRFAVFRVP